MVRAAGLVLSLAYAAAIVWLYAAQPQTVAEVTGGISAGLGVYRVDAQARQDGLGFFHRDAFPEARAAFDRADPASRDPEIQFYIAYSYYRQGWGRCTTMMRSSSRDWRPSTGPSPPRPGTGSSSMIRRSTCTPPTSSRPN